MADCEIFDNLLSEEDFTKIQEIFLGDNFPWFYQDHILQAEKDADRFQFTHNLYRDGEQSPYLELVGPVLHAIKATNVYRVKANIKGRTPEAEVGGWHTDFPPEELVCMTGVFYLNDNNGYTVFEDGSKVESKANRFVAFRSDQKHSGVSHTDVKVRCLINFNYDV